MADFTPANVPSGLVIGIFSRLGIDGPDPDKTPDETPIPNVRAKFVPQLATRLLRNRNVTPARIHYVDDVEVSTGDQGAIVLREDLGVQLTSNMVPGLQPGPGEWTWQCQLYIDEKLIEAFYFNVPINAGESEHNPAVNLGELVPVAPGTPLPAWWSSLEELRTTAVADSLLILEDARKARTDAQEAAADAAAFGGTNLEIVSALVSSQIANPETPANNAVVTVVVETLDGFTLDEVPLLVEHGDAANFARPDTVRPVWWQGTVAPNRRLAGDSFFLVEAEPVPEPEPWSPLDIGTLVGWWDIESLAAIANNAAVTSWVDSGPNEYDLTAFAVGSSGATISPAMRVDGLRTNERAVYLAAKSGMEVTFPALGTGPLTLAFNARLGPQTSGTETLINGQSSTTHSLGFYRTSTGAVGYRRGGSNLVSAAGTDDNLAHTYVLVFNGLSSTMYRDGTAIIPAAGSSTGNPGEGDVTALRLGIRDSAAGQYITNGFIGDLLLMKGVPDETLRAEITDFLTVRREE